MAAVSEQMTEACAGDSQAELQNQCVGSAGSLDVHAPCSLPRISRSQSHIDLGEKLDEEKGAGLLLQILLCAISAIEGADLVMLPSVFLALQRDLNLSLTNLATVTLFQALFQNAAAPVWGVLADRGILRRKTILVIGSLLQGVVTCVLSGIDALVPMILLRSLNGAMLASLRPVSMALLADVTTESRRGTVYGWIFFALNIGQMVGSLATPMSTQRILGFQGWRVAFFVIGILSILVGVVVAVLMTEPERPKSQKADESKTSGLMDEVKRIVSFCRMPTFIAIVLQGCFGCVPWQALSYRTLFFQVGGLSDLEASVLQALGLVASAAGGLLGGVLGDCAVRRCRLHGRPLVAQISVFSGIPLACLTFMVDPPSTGTFWYYLFLVVMLGLTATWCGSGVNPPILSEIVPANSRSTIMCWQTALEGSFSAVCGNALVGLLAQDVFGYDLSNASREGASDPHSRRALGSALSLTVALPWVLCLGFYTMLHWSYPRDLQRVQRERDAAKQLKADKKDEQRRARLERSANSGLSVKSNKIGKEEEPESSMPRLAASAHAALAKASMPCVDLEVEANDTTTVSV